MVEEDGGGIRVRVRVRRRNWMPGSRASGMVERGCKDKLNVKQFFFYMELILLCHQ